MKFLYLLTAFCFCTSVVFAQNYRVSKPPIDGTITIAKKRPIGMCGLGSEYRGVDIQSDSSIVYSIAGGEVTACVKVSDWYIVLVRRDSFYYCYGNFKKVFIDKHQVIKANTPIGELELDNDDKYTLAFSVWDNQKPHSQLIPLAPLLKLLNAQKIAD